MVLCSLYARTAHLIYIRITKKTFDGKVSCSRTCTYIKNHHWLIKECGEIGYEVMFVLHVNLSTFWVSYRIVRLGCILHVELQKPHPLGTLGLCFLPSNSLVPHLVSKAEDNLL